MLSLTDSLCAMQPLIPRTRRKLRSRNHKRKKRKLSLPLLPCSSLLLSNEEFYSTPPALRRMVRSVEVSTEASPVDETSSPPVRSTISFARFTSSELAQCTERRIPPF